MADGARTAPPRRRRRALDRDARRARRSQVVVLNGGTITAAPSVPGKYDEIAFGYSEHDYADPAHYAEERARIVVTLGPRAEAGDSVLSLGCGDGNVAAALARRGLRYRGVDASPRMVEAARLRNPGLPFEWGRSETYVPPAPVDITICLRSYYYPADRVAFFANVASYTRKKFVLDFRPRTHDLASIVADLERAGFGEFALRAFFLPQRHRVPPGAAPALRLLARTGSPALAATRLYGRIFCAAVPVAALLVS